MTKTHRDIVEFEMLPRECKMYLAAMKQVLLIKTNPTGNKQLDSYLYRAFDIKADHHYGIIERCERALQDKEFGL